jgi:hypothetical protein
MREARTMTHEAHGEINPSRHFRNRLDLHGSVRDARLRRAPHHEGLVSLRETGPHPEGPPEAGVSKDGRKRASRHFFVHIGRAACGAQNKNGENNPMQSRSRLDR